MAASMPFHLLARRFVGLAVPLSKRKLCHLVGPQSQEMVWARQLAGDDDTPIWTKSMTLTLKSSTPWSLTPPLMTSSGSRPT
jgi:hypothetical protein